MKIKIITDAIKVTERVLKQTKFAMARALTESANFAKYDAIQKFPTYFHQRSAWVIKGFRVLAASRDKLRAVVGHYEKTNFMKAHAEGGVRKARSGSEQAVPNVGASVQGPGGGVAMPRGTSGERATYRGSNWPKQLAAQIDKAKMAAKQAAQGPTARNRRSGERKLRRSKAGMAGMFMISGKKWEAIVVRVRPGRGKGSYLPLWFMTKETLSIKKDWPFYVDAEAAVAASFSPLFKNFVTQYAGDVRIP